MYYICRVWSQNRVYFLQQFQFYQNKYLLCFVHAVSLAAGPVSSTTRVLKPNLVNGWLERGDPELFSGELGEGKNNSSWERITPPFFFLYECRSFCIDCEVRFSLHLFKGKGEENQQGKRIVSFPDMLSFSSPNCCLDKD